MKILFYKHDDDSTAWLADLAEHLPQAETRIWRVGDNDPADYMLIWKPPFELLQARAGVKAVFNLGAGLDVLLDCLRKHPGLLPADVPLIKLDDAGMGEQMTQYVGHAVLRHFRRLEDYARLQQSGSWQALPPRVQSAYEIGVMGLGALGAQVAASLAAMGFPVRGWSRSVKQLEGVRCFSGEDALPTFLDGLQVLVNMLPLTAETENILERRLFARLAPGAKLINVARGAHLVEEDLLEALASGQLGSAALDVFRTEPLPPDHPFWGEPRVEITPHISALTARTESIRQIAAKIDALEKGLAVSGVADFARGY